MRVEQSERVLGPAFVVLDEHEQLAKDLGEVAAVDLVDDEEVVVVEVVCRVLAGRVERAFCELEPSDDGLKLSTKPSLE